MCCSRRRRNAACGARGGYRRPMVAVLGKMAYDKYQERKQQRSIEANGSTTAQPAQEVNLSEKADAQPPSYDELVVNRAIVPEKHVNVNEKDQDIDWTALKEVVDETARSLDGDHAYATANGMNYSNVPMNGQSCHRGGCGGGCGGHGRCSQGCGGYGGCQRGCGGGCQGGCGMANTMHYAPVAMNAEPGYTGGCQSRCQQKKAAKAARKAEKEAAKRGMRMM